MKIISSELFQRHPDNPILTADDWPYPANTVFNCGAAVINGQTVLLTRVEDKRGISHLTKAISKDGVTNWQIDSQPTFSPDPENYPEEDWGIEDPRITYINDFNEYFFTYTSYSEAGPLISLAKTKDFVVFKKMGVLMPPENKDAALFPVRFNKGWAMIHRPTYTISSAKSYIWISFSPDLQHWGDHSILIKTRGEGWWDAFKIGLSAPPLQIPEGWLILYHGVRRTGSGFIYRLGLALLDLENPARLLRHSDEWIFGPQQSYERKGDVDNVVFPCGWIVENDIVRLYYGGADTCIALATAKLEDLREYILKCPKN